MRRSSSLSLSVLVLVVLADILFYDAATGWTAGLFLAAIGAALALRYRGAIAQPPVALLLVALVGLVAAMVIEPGPLEIVLAVVLAAALPMTARHGWTRRIGDWAWRAAHVAAIAVTRPILDLAICRRWTVRHGDHRTNLLVRLGRWVVPVLLAAVFVVLFRLANPIIEHWLDELGRRVQHVSDYVAAARLALWMATAWGAWSLLRMRLDRRLRRGSVQGAHAVTPPPIPGASGSRWHQSLIIRSLVLFNAVFAVQLVLDAIYLWRGAALPDGLTYAEYAQRGAYPLMISALLAGAFVIAAFRDRSPVIDSRAARALVFVWLAQNEWMLVSALRRLDLYVDVYALTRWRVAAAVWMAVVAIGLIWLIVRLIRRKSNAWLLGVNLLTALAVCYACCFVNFDGAIAWFNVRHNRGVTGPETGAVELDVEYLRGLGYEAIPALRWYSARTSRPDHAQAAQRAARQLAQHMDEQMSDWRGWTLRRDRVLRRIADRAEDTP